MSGHITKMSRGSSVGSSASRPSSTSRSTSTCRAGPWQLCTWTDRSSSRSIRPSRPNGVGGDVGLQPAEQRVGLSAAVEVFVGRAGPLAGCAPARADRGRGWPAAGARRRGGWCRRGGGSHRGCRRARATARRWDAAATGAGRGGWPVRCSSSMSVNGSRVCPNSDSRCGRSVGTSRSRATVFWWRMCGGSASMRSISARHRYGCQARSSSRSPACRRRASRPAVAAAAGRRRQTARPGAAPTA